jgi:biotin---protein ligase
LKGIDIKLKWPNDIYADGSVKLGGLLVSSILEGNTAICSIGKCFECFKQGTLELWRLFFFELQWLLSSHLIKTAVIRDFPHLILPHLSSFQTPTGLGINFANSIPTTCINDVIAAYNKKYSKNLPLLTYEKTLAHIFNEIESILNRVQGGDIEYLYDLYYKCWLHR